MDGAVAEGPRVDPAPERLGLACGLVGVARAGVGGEHEAGVGAVVVLLEARVRLGAAEVGHGGSRCGGGGRRVRISSTSNLISWGEAIGVEIERGGRLREVCIPLWACGGGWRKGPPRALPAAEEDSSAVAAAGGSEGGLCGAFPSLNLIFDDLKKNKKCEANDDA